MPTRLSRTCDGIIEAAWLGAVILVPLFFNIYSSRIFEPDKITLLRSLVLLLLGAWIIKLIEEGGARWDAFQPAGSKIRFLLKFPMVTPVIAMGLLYLISTIFSVTPRVSFLGSYQRLQGTYTTFSYLIMFAALLVNLRKRAQVERIITIIVLVSLPISLYGVLQKYSLDPIPWGGDTSARIAANMGNSIFIAAYLIMVFPLTVARIIQSLGAILKTETGLWNHVARATIYIFIGALQLIAMYMSQSRGPVLGLLAGMFFLFLLLSLHWQMKRLAIGIIAVTGAVAIFLLIFNIPGGPLENLRSSPAIGRFGLLLDSQSNSALVRKYIWQGAADLVSIHEPLSYPDGSVDSKNIIRPLVGYGPESMYVAYNPFYIPALAQVERRNASPDRSHNETWDSLVITGVLGIVVYLSIFISVFYYALKWLGHIGSQQQRLLFFSLIVFSGIIGGFGFGAWRGIEYFGVGLPFGMTVGIGIYLIVAAITYRPQDGKNQSEKIRSLTLIVLLAAIISHFVEINFGIAIGSTRTYFWMYAGLIVVVGAILPIYQQYEQRTIANPDPEEITTEIRTGSMSTQKRKKRGKIEPVITNQNRSKLIEGILPPAILITIVISTLGYNVFNNPRGFTSAWSVIWSSITRLPNQNWASSPGILALILITLIFMTIILTGETYTMVSGRSWWKTFGLILGFSLGFSLVYWILHAGALASIAANTATDLSGVLRQVGRYELLLARYYLYIFVLVVALGFVLAPAWKSGDKKHTARGLVGTAVTIAAIFLIVVLTNLRVIQADIVFKLAEPFTRTGQWPVAITIYNRANQLAPNEDYYFLFLGRAYLEHAKLLSDSGEREALINQAERDLRRAQAINPLNTDHTANLARLFSLWASFSQDQQIRYEKARISSDYFSSAVRMSPNSARLWDEWALLTLNLLQDPDAAQPLITRSLEIDSNYHWTYAMLGDMYLRKSMASENSANQMKNLEAAVDAYTKAVELAPASEQQSRLGYLLALASTHVQIGDLPHAIRIYSDILAEAPSGTELWRLEETIGNLYNELGDEDNAILHYNKAIELAPDDQKAYLQALLDQLFQSQP